VSSSLTMGPTENIWTRVW